MAKLSNTTLKRIQKATGYSSGKAKRVASKVRKTSSFRKAVRDVTAKTILSDDPISAKYNSTMRKLNKKHSSKYKK